jgi:hypothetical protein
LAEEELTTPTASEPVTRGEFELAMARLEGRLDTRFAQLETAIERATLRSVRWIVGLILPLYAVMFGLILCIVSRELPR